MTTDLTLVNVSDALRPLIPFGSHVNLLARLPFDRVRVANFIAKHDAELEAILRRKIVVERAEYVPSGRGAFGRLKGGQSATSRKLAVRWE